jgi:hypothetical protein
LLAASLDDIIRSKRAAGRDKNRAVIDILEKTRDEEAAALAFSGETPQLSSTQDRVAGDLPLDH